jgi:hypothetical protein
MKRLFSPLVFFSFYRRVRLHGVWDMGEQISLSRERLYIASVGNRK